MPKVIATPINGARVRKPDGQLLNDEGEPVERDSFWLRREKDGDVTLTPVPAGAPATDAPDENAVSPAPASPDASDATDATGDSAVSPAPTSRTRKS